MGSTRPDALNAVTDMVRAEMAERQGLRILGIAGSQGSGKSTLAAALKDRLENDGVPVALLSIDDLYRTRAEREELARTVHPLLRTRGVPGTHDVALGLGVMDALRRGEAAPLPRFDKAMDDRLPQDLWERAAAGTRLLILEGWCVGAQPQDASALVAPVNRLEAVEDGDGRWRRFVNHALTVDYPPLFAQMDRFVFLAAPSFDVILRWRIQQEQNLRRSSAAAKGVMDDDAIARFIQHYERLTRHMLAEAPGYADLTIRLDADRGIDAIEQR